MPSETQIQEWEAAIRASQLFDSNWYGSEYPDVLHLKMDPLEHYVLMGFLLQRKPNAYLTREAFPDIYRLSQKNREPALVTYIRGHPNSTSAELMNAHTQATKRAIPSRRLAVFASYDKDSIIRPHLVHYLSALARHVDDLIFVSDNPITPGELSKIEPYVQHHICERHGEYDFGSYKRGYHYFKKAGLLDKAASLLLCNDSCFGPFFGFDALFDVMDRAECDFWGITASNQISYHLQSYFISLSRSAFSSEIFDTFISGVVAEDSVQDVIRKYEIGLSSRLIAGGFRPRAYISDTRPKSNPLEKKTEFAEHYPLFLLSCGAPLLKMKALKNSNCNLDGIASTLSALKNLAPEIYDVVIQYPEIHRFERSRDIAFSVVMPTRNRANSIERAIQSLLDQTHTNFELIVVDDGSTDDTREILQTKFARELSSRKIIYLSLPKHVGVSAARNIAAFAATNPWIAYLDSDNFVRPYFLETFAQSIVVNPSSRVFYAQLSRLNDGHVTGKPFEWKSLLSGNYIDIGVFVHHRECLDHFGAFDTQLKRLVDWDLILRYTRQYHPLFIPHVLMDYSNGIGPDRISNREPASNAKLRIQKKHLNLPTVTTLLLSYNQEQYIEKAVESVLAQKGNFIHEIIFSDDGSTDGTQAVLAAYSRANPLTVNNISAKANQGMVKNFQKGFAHVTGDYVAILEGDDYWTDDSKLEQQIAFLEANPDCSMVFSRIEVHSTANGSVRLLRRQDNLKDKLDGSDFLAHTSMNLIGNFSSCLFRTKLMKELPAALYGHRLSEIAVAFHLEKAGKIGYIAKPMSVYRQHPQGVWTGSNRREQLESGIETRRIVRSIARPVYRDEIDRIIESQYAQPLMKLGAKSLELTA